jgi:hypothetical protein
MNELEQLKKGCGNSLGGMYKGKCGHFSKDGIRKIYCATCNAKLKGVAIMCKELNEHINNRRIECTLRFGEWWIKLSSLLKIIT